MDTMTEIKFTTCNCKVTNGQLNIDDIPLDCSAVWKMLAAGHTTGVFQLEKKLGKDWSQKVKPESIQEIAVLIALLRPGAIESGQSQQYVDVKFGYKKPIILHPLLKSILESTHYCLIFQEQALQIAIQLAGFDPEKADLLRIAVGKKKPELMAKLKDDFINGCITNKISKDIGEQIFGWIEKGQRYSFNKCLGGKEIIRRPVKRNRFECQLNIEEMYKIRNDINYAKESGHLSLYKKWKLLGNYGYGLSLCDDNRIRLNIIKNILYVGIEKLYGIVLENNATISVTDNHKFPTPKGIKHTNQLKIGDELFICGKKDEYKKGRTKIFEKGYPVLKCRIKSINYIGYDSVYDVEMNNPYHTLVTSNDIITSNSHSIAYSMLTYTTCWLKCHFPREFFTSYLTYSKYKGDPKEEIYNLVQDARFFGINIVPPDIKRGNIDFQMINDDKESIAFGLSHIRGVGKAGLEKIKSNNNLNTWNGFLSSVPELHRDVGLALIKSGACDCYDKERSDMVRDLELILGNEENPSLTSREKEFFFNKLNNYIEPKDILIEMGQSSKEKPLCQRTKSELIELLINHLTNKNSIFDIDSEFKYTTDFEKSIWINQLTKRHKNDLLKLLNNNGYVYIPKQSPCANTKRRQLMLTKAQSLTEPTTDTSTARAMAEKSFLGISLSCSAIDDVENHGATHTCLDAARENNHETISICAIVDNVKITQTKRGKNPGQQMCFLTLSDSTYSLESVVVFPSFYEKLKAFCKKDLIGIFYGKKNKGSIIIEDITKLI